MRGLIVPLVLGLLIHLSGCGFDVLRSRNAVYASELAHPASPQALRRALQERPGLLEDPTIRANLHHDLMSAIRFCHADYVQAYLDGGAGPLRSDPQLPTRLLNGQEAWFMAHDLRQTTGGPIDPVGFKAKLKGANDTKRCSVDCSLDREWEMHLSEAGRLQCQQTLMAVMPSFAEHQRDPRSAKAGYIGWVTFAHSVGLLGFDDVLDYLLEHRLVDPKAPIDTRYETYEVVQRAGSRKTDQRNHTAYTKLLANGVPNARTLQVYFRHGVRPSSEDLAYYLQAGGRRPDVVAAFMAAGARPDARATYLLVVNAAYGAPSSFGHRSPTKEEAIARSTELLATVVAAGADYQWRGGEGNALDYAVSEVGSPALASFLSNLGLVESSRQALQADHARSDADWEEALKQVRRRSAERSAQDHQRLLAECKEQLQHRREGKGAFGAIGVSRADCVAAGAFSKSEVVAADKAVTDRREADRALAAERAAAQARRPNLAGVLIDGINKTGDAAVQEIERAGQEARRAVLEQRRAQAALERTAQGNPQPSGDPAVVQLQEQQRRATEAMADAAQKEAESRKARELEAQAAAARGARLDDREIFANSTAPPDCLDGSTPGLGVMPKCRADSGYSEGEACQKLSDFALAHHGGCTPDGQPPGEFVPALWEASSNGPCQCGEKNAADGRVTCSMSFTYACMKQADSDASGTNRVDDI